MGSFAVLPPAEALPGPLIYVLENDRISAVITELIVKKNLCGGEVRTFPNGQHAFEALTTAANTGAAVPRLVLLDLDMPLMDGWEFLDALPLLALTQPPVVFVVTSSIHPDDELRASRHPRVWGYFSKPLDEGSLARMRQRLYELNIIAEAKPATLVRSC